MDRVEIKIYSRRTIPASSVNDESVVDDVNVVKVFISNPRDDGPKQRHKPMLQVHAEVFRGLWPDIKVVDDLHSLAALEQYGQMMNEAIDS